MKRRSFLTATARTAALAGLGDLGFLGRLQPVSAAELKMPAGMVARAGGPGRVLDPVPGRAGSPGGGRASGPGRAPSRGASGSGRGLHRQKSARWARRLALRSFDRIGAEVEAVKGLTSGRIDVAALPTLALAFGLACLEVTD